VYTETSLDSGFLLGGEFHSMSPLISAFASAVGEDPFGRPAKPLSFMTTLHKGSIFSARR